MIVILVSLILFYVVHKNFNIVNLFNPLVYAFVNHLIFLFFALSYADLYTHIYITDFTKVMLYNSIFGIVIGGLLSHYFFRKVLTWKFNAKWPVFQFVEKKVFTVEGVIAFIFIVCGVFFTLFFVYKTGHILLFESEVENLRIELRRGNGLITKLAILFLTYGYIMLLGIKIPRLFRIVLLIIVSICIANFGNRGPLLFLYAYIFIANLVIRSKKVRLVNVVVIFGLLFSLLVLLGALRTNYDADLWTLFQSRFGWRPFVNIQNLQTILNFFPGKHDFLYGETYWVDVQLLFPGSHPNSGLFLKDLMNLTFDGGSLTPSYLGLLYINFGLVIPFLMPLMFGFISNSLYVLIGRYIKINSTIRLVNLLMISSFIGAAVISGLLTSVMQGLPIVIIINCIYFILRAGLRSFQKSKLLSTI